jgi:hypothetical protein
MFFIVLISLRASLARLGRVYRSNSLGACARNTQTRLKPAWGPMAFHRPPRQERRDELRMALAAIRSKTRQRSALHYPELGPREACPRRWSPHRAPLGAGDVRRTWGPAPVWRASGALATSAADRLPSGQVQDTNPHSPLAGLPFPPRFAKIFRIVSVSTVLIP